MTLPPLPPRAKRPYPSAPWECKMCAAEHEDAADVCLGPGNYVNAPVKRIESIYSGQYGTSLRQTSGHALQFRGRSAEIDIVYSTRSPRVSPRCSNAVSADFNPL